MSYKKACIILNPSSGMPEPILSIVNDFFQSFEGEWSIKVTMRSGDAKRFTTNAIENGADVIVIYGGDGTVMEAAQALMNTKIPLLILPGGSANIMAKELGLPVTPAECLQLLHGKSQERTIDMGMMNSTPFLLRISVGGAADLVLNTTPELKSSYGQLAYTFTAFQQMTSARETEYSITIDGKEERVTGTSLLVVNTANMGFTDLPFLPTIKVDDGVFDLLVLRSNSWADIAATLTEALLYQKITDNMIHRSFSRANIKILGDQRIICDDEEVRISEMSISVVPQAIRCIVPYLQV